MYLVSCLKRVVYMIPHCLSRSLPCGSLSGLFLSYSLSFSCFFSFFFALVVLYVLRIYTFVMLNGCTGPFHSHFALIYIVIGAMKFKTIGLCLLFCFCFYYFSGLCVHYLFPSTSCLKISRFHIAWSVTLLNSPFQFMCNIIFEFYPVQNESR